MSKIAYATKNFNPTAADVVATADRITTEYAGQGYRMTLRMLYYQFIARDLFPESWRDAQLGTKNTQANYKKLGRLVSDGRIGGLIDWAYIEDTGRESEGGDYGYAGPAHRVRTLPDGYSITKWDGQPNYVEVWVEKDALAEVIAGPCRTWNVVHQACKGSPSTSLMYESARRLRRQEINGRECTVYYLGDHDPTGLDIDRDVQERLRLYRSNARVERIALTWDQVEQFSPPPSPVKVTDSRATGYLDQFGTDECWELDALEPGVLVGLVEQSILGKLDMRLWNERERQEQRDLVELQAIAQNWESIRSYMDREDMLDYSEVDQADADAESDDDDDDDDDPEYDR